MFFAVHNEEGRITQGNKVYDPEGYEDLLREHNYKFVAANVPGLLLPDDWYVTSKELHQRPTMPIEVSKTTIRVGVNDSALFTNCPAKATFTVRASGAVIYSGTLDATVLEISIPVPCVYEVELNLWPYRTFTQRIEAVA